MSLVKLRTANNKESLIARKQLTKLTSATEAENNIHFTFTLPKEQISVRSVRSNCQYVRMKYEITRK